MSEHAKAFIRYLVELKGRDRGALATLRHSLAFDPGAYPKAFQYVERFVRGGSNSQDAHRLALYAVAGLFARHPEPRPESFASAFGTLMSRPGKGASIEQRFIALLAADAENIVHYLRQAVSLLAANQIGFDYGRLLDDLSRWMDPNRDPQDRDRLRQYWAREFYRASQAERRVDFADIAHLEHPE